MRQANLKRKTTETDISLKLNLDGSGQSKISTGVGFFDHMLELFAKHGSFDLDLNCAGDLNVDCHHSIEDIGIVLGSAVKEALGDKVQITRYSSIYLPMDEALALVVMDISGRNYLHYDVPVSNENVGEFKSEMAEEFFYAFCSNAGVTLHIKLEYGKNAHHILEAVFKGFGRALKAAVAIDENAKGVPSTKGVL
ncbi:MAG: imidazoleglycerol-phosphate dehydratase HisB [Coriobacteriales bacterium]|nr:imidazoleglycerol-phosphate dehydratase HisB [Coriobacteriales bacterium]